MKKTMTCRAYTKAVDEEQRTVEQIVSVFNNVDLGGDRVNEGAFVKSLEDWAASSNQMSAYFSHQWDDPFSNIGAVIDAKELPPGDPTLPDDQVVTDDGKTLRDLGGLWVKYQVDPAGQNPKADQVFFLLKERRIVQASFAYDIVEQKRNSDGTNDLLQLNVIEVGPTLLGMNPATDLLSAKSLETLAKETGATSEQVTAIVEAVMKDLTPALNTELKSVSFAGSIEERQSAIYDLVDGWARENDIGNGGFYATHLEATFDDRAVFLIEGWNDPYGEGAYYEAAISNNDDGSYAMSEPEEVIVEQSVRPKALSSAAKAKMFATLSPDKDVTKSGNTSGNAKAEAGVEASTSGSSESKVTSDPLLSRLEIETALTELET